jgi:hypothetical protein
MSNSPQELRSDSDIFAIARFIEQHVTAHWDGVFQACRQEMIDRYDEIGDAVYGLYATRLFQPILKEMRKVGLKSAPRLPTGGFADSREWGEDEADRQRWFWSKITKVGTTQDVTALGTIAVAFHHDHLQIRIPRPMQIMALTETSKGAVVAALSRLSPEFGQALEARVEYAAYYEQNATG